MGAQANWLDMTPDLFDADARPVQGALFPAPDRYGTPDLFDGAEAAEVPVTAAPPVLPPFRAAGVSDFPRFGSDEYLSW